MFSDVRSCAVKTHPHSTYQQIHKCPTQDVCFGCAASMYNHLFQLGALSKLTSWLRWRQEVHHKDDVQTRWKGLRSSHQWAARIVPMSGAVVEAQLWANYSDRKHDQKPQKGSFLEGTSRLVKYYNLAHHTITGGCSRQRKSSCFLTFWFGGQGWKKTKEHHHQICASKICFGKLSFVPFRIKYDFKTVRLLFPCGSRRSPKYKARCTRIRCR